MDEYSVQGAEHDEIISAESELEAEDIFLDMHPGEEIISTMKI